MAHLKINLPVGLDDFDPEDYAGDIAKDGELLVTVSDSKSDDTEIQSFVIPKGQWNLLLEFC